MKQDIRDTMVKALSAVEVGAYFYEEITENRHPLSLYGRVYEDRELDDLEGNYFTEEYGDLLETCEDILT